VAFFIPTSNFIFLLIESKLEIFCKVNSPLSITKITFAVRRIAEEPFKLIVPSVARPSIALIGYSAQFNTMIFIY